MSLDARALALKVAEAAWDKKAFDLKILHVREQLQITDYFVLCSGRSDRQVLAIAENIEAAAHGLGLKPLSIEGQRWGRWVCMDFGDIVVHVFYHEVRHLYDLESLWVDAPEVEVQEPEWVRAEAARAAGEY